MVFSPEVMINYQKIFSFLWRIKQIEKGLHSIWKVDIRKRIEKLPRNGKDLSKVFHVSYGIRSMMIGFIFTLSKYTYSHIVTCFRQFTKPAGHSSNRSLRKPILLMLSWQLIDASSSRFLKSLFALLNTRTPSRRYPTSLWSSATSAHSTSNFLSRSTTTMNAFVCTRNDF